MKTLAAPKLLQTIRIPKRRFNYPEIDRFFDLVSPQVCTKTLVVDVCETEPFLDLALEQRMSRVNKHSLYRKIFWFLECFQTTVSVGLLETQPKTILFRKAKFLAILWGEGMPLEVPSHGLKPKSITVVRIQSVDKALRQWPSISMIYHRKTELEIRPRDRY